AAPSGIATAEAFGTAKLSLALTGAGNIATAEALGTPIVSTPGGAQTISDAGGIASAESFGAAAISAVQAAAGAGQVIRRRRVFVSIDDAVRPRPALPEAQALGALGIASLEAFGVAALRASARIEPAPIAPRSDMGSPTLRMRRPRALRRAEERGLLFAA
ncbi:MAG: hypothetical protein L0210_06945, partial [Rhodospirillales bacterium]|nr:hypothetical protein [Rhodospirillales bacterium]